MATDAELNEFDKLFAEDASKVDLSGQYASAIQELTRASQEAQAGGTAAVADAQTYSQLIVVVEHARDTNLNQAELKNRIVALGETAVGIARKVAGLAALFA
jgi:hypothetical protein